MQKVSGILIKLLKQYGLEGKIIEYTIADKWEEITGKIIASHTYPAGLHHKRLYVIVDSSAWLQELSFYKNEIIEKVNNHFNKNIVNDIYLKTGQMQENVNASSR